MRNVYYMVGKDGAYTRCNTLLGAEEQKRIGAMNGVEYEIKTCFEKVERRKLVFEPLRQAFLDTIGRVPTTAR